MHALGRHGKNSSITEDSFHILIGRKRYGCIVNFFCIAEWPECLSNPMWQQPENNIVGFKAVH